MIKDKISKDFGQGLLAVGNYHGDMVRNLVGKWGFVVTSRVKDCLAIEFRQTKVKEKIRKEDFYHPDSYQQNVFYVKFPMKPFLDIPYVKH